VFDGVLGNRVITQHFFNEVNPPTGTIELIAEQDVSGAGRRTKPAMSTVSQDLLGLGNSGIGELFGREIGPHELVPFDDAAAV
jgi:hypothetical protein